MLIGTLRIITFYEKSPVLKRGQKDEKVKIVI